MDQCGASGKREYKTEEEAMKATKKMARRHRLLFKHYYCKHCTFFHLTRIKREQPP